MNQTARLCLRLFFLLVRATGLCAMLCGASAALAEDFGNFDFSLRLPAALARFSPYPDVAGVGGASAGSRYSTSTNPAATDWDRALEHPVSLSPQYSAIRFGTGPTLHIVTAAATINTESFGSFQPAVTEIRNNGSQTGDFLLLEGRSAQIQWGYKISDSFAIGANLNYTPMDTKGGLGGFLLATGHGVSYGKRVGVLWAPASRLIAGLVIDHARSPATAESFDPACSCFVTSTDTTTQLLVRPGISYEYAEKSSVYVDYQRGHYRNLTGSLSTNRLFAGMEHLVLPWLFARVGFVRDSRGNSSGTLGVGVSPSDALSIDIAYQNAIFPELNPEFGRSKLFAISASLSF